MGDGQVIMTRVIVTAKKYSKLAEQLANLRGAAMKLGQLLSMDSGELLTPKLSAILARLRRSDTYAAKAAS